jgi:Ca2+/H+ antiporter, TMEM165/GDT1 family
VDDVWTAFWLSYGVVFVAELGGKSQLIALTFATRYRPVLVMTGIAGQGVVFTVGSAFLLAELGDKTMLAAITLAAQNGWLGTGSVRWPA